MLCRNDCNIVCTNEVSVANVCGEIRARGTRIIENSEDLIIAIRLKNMGLDGAIRPRYNNKVKLQKSPALCQHRQRPL